MNNQNQKSKTEKFLNKLKIHGVTVSTIPPGFIGGLPIVGIVNRQVCLTVPYFGFIRAKREANKSLIYPVKYSISALWATGRVIRFNDLEYDDCFQKIDFSKPVGIFRHDAIKEYNAKQYKEKLEELYSMYDKLIDFLETGDTYSDKDEEEFKNLLNIIIEPSLIPFYRHLDRKFVDRFLYD